MNEEDIKRLTRPYFLAEPHSTVLNLALAKLFSVEGEGCVRVTKRKRPDGSYSIAVEALNTSE